MGNIVLLDDLTINKIAAGEVIERPASVIKELVENSIDAGANNITIEIKNGGISYIRVADNGKGIAPDDLEIAFERHATSKIRNAEDLDVVTSMGFRGEALASIASIANVELTSKTESQTTGYKITVEAGNVLDKQEVGCQTGTSIVVKNLFFNTPVRYKFLKKDYTEAGYIEDVVTRVALVHPEIAIKLINTGKTVIQTNGNGDIKAVIYSIYGKDIAQSVLPVDYKYEDIEITGVIGKPEVARSNRSNQLFFVNKRYIKDKMLSSATEQAFKGLITIGKYGFVILNINMNPAKVDVNVHPAKLEVRFEDEGKIFQAVYHAIKNTLLENELVADTGKIENNEKSTSKGLFNFRRSDTKQIEKYNDNESKIKTHFGTPETKSSINVGNGGPVNTADILEQLKKMRENLKKEVGEDNLVDEPMKKLENELEENKNKTISDITILNDTGSNENTSNESVSNETGNIVNAENNTTEPEKIETQPENEIQVENGTETEVKIENTENEVSEDKEKNTSLDGTKEIPNEKLQEIADKEINEKKEKIEKIDEQIKKIEESKDDEEPLDFDTMYEKLFGRKPIESEENSNSSVAENVTHLNNAEDDPNAAKDLKENNISVFDQEEEYQKPVYKFIGILFNTYIIIEMDNEMYMIDQHAAHERILYEKVKKNYYSNSSSDSQLLLLPDIITLTHKEMDVARENMDIFRKAGFVLEEFGENTIKLTGVPTICIDLDNKDLFMETLDEIETISRTSKQEKEERFIATVACKAAVKAGMVLSRQEVDELIEGLLKLPNPFTCPHGRPTTIKMSRYEIERKFSRK